VTDEGLYNRNILSLKITRHGELLRIAALAISESTDAVVSMITFRQGYVVPHSGYTEEELVG
jgi:hypothetical protein